MEQIDRDAVRGVLFALVPREAPGVLLYAGDGTTVKLERTSPIPWGVLEEAACAGAGVRFGLLPPTVGRHESPIFSCGPVLTEQTYRSLLPVSARLPRRRSSRIPVAVPPSGGFTPSERRRPRA